MIDLSEKYLIQNNLVFIENSNPVLLLIEKIKKIKTINKNRRIENLFVGNIEEFSEKLCAININCSKLWSLDDGAKTLVLNEAYNQQEQINCFKTKSSFPLVKKILIKAFFLQSVKYKQINWFTIFNFKPKNGGSFMNHSLSKFKDLIGYDGKYSENGNIYFIGTNLINAGVIKKREYYFSALKEILSFYEKKEIVYIPHRKESKQDLLEVEKLGFTILHLNQIVEVAFLEKNIYPTTIASFFSTALYSLSNLFPKSNVNFFETNKDQINEGFISSTTTVEKEYKITFGVTKK